MRDFATGMVIAERKREHSSSYKQAALEGAQFFDLHTGPGTEFVTISPQTMQGLKSENHSLSSQVLSLAKRSTYKDEGEATGGSDPKIGLGETKVDVHYDSSTNAEFWWGTMIQSTYLRT